MNIDTIKISVFENIKRMNEFHSEYWSARELARILEYSEYRNFEMVLQKAKESCKNSDQTIRDHFGDVTEMIKPSITQQCHRETVLTAWRSHRDCFVAGSSQ